MAIKDWKKKAGTPSYIIVFYYFSAPTRKIIISELSKKLLTGEQFYVQGENTQEVFRVKFFKTKSQALKYAKEYMRKH